MLGEASYHFDKILEGEGDEDDGVYAEEDQKSYLGAVGTVLPR